MIELRCGDCRMLWREDRRRDDSPIGPVAFCCPRCGAVGAIVYRDDDPPPAPERPDS